MEESESTGDAAGGGRGHDTTSVSIIVPVLNEQGSLETLLARITGAVKPMHRTYEIIFVDDGSTDGSWDLLTRLAAGDASVRLVRLRRNFGQTQALMAGIAHARHPILVTLDADLQNDPGDIPAMVATLRGSCDLVQGWRRHRQDPWLTRRLPSWCANVLVRMATGVPAHDVGCGLRAFRQELVREVNLYRETHRFVPVLVHSIGRHVVEKEVTHHPRFAGKSNYGLSRPYTVVVDLLRMMARCDAATHSRYVFAAVGLLSTVLGLLPVTMLGYRVVAAQRSEVTPLLLFGVVFAMTALLSALTGSLAEVFVRSRPADRGRPAYPVRETLGCDSGR